MSQDLRDRVYIVTGGSKGLGAAMAAGKAAELVFNDDLMGYQMSGLLWE